ncbi:MAG: hypothetical protein ABW252_01715 [Polyangiales bacterium]
MTARALRALPMTFLVYAIEAALAAFAVLPGALELTPGWAASPGPRLEALRIDALLSLGAVGRTSLRGFALAALALFVVGPFLQMSWLSALTSPMSVQRSLAQGARSTPRAWLVSLGMLVPTALAVAPALGAAYLVNRFVADDRARDLALAACALGLGAALLWAHAAHDVARAQALARRAGASVLFAVRASLWPPLLLRAALAFVVGLALPALALWLASLVATRPYGVLLGVLLLQSALLGRLMLRAWWLAAAVSARAEAPASSDSGTT